MFKFCNFIISITNAVNLLSLKDLKRQLDRGFWDLRLQIREKSYNVKLFKGAGPENLSVLKVISSLAIMDHENK